MMSGEGARIIPADIGGVKDHRPQTGKRGRHGVGKLANRVPLGRILLLADWVCVARDGIVSSAALL